MLTWNFSLWTLWRQTAKASSKMNSWELTIFWMYPSVWWSFSSSNLSTLNRKAGSIKIDVTKQYLTFESYWQRLIVIGFSWGALNVSVKDDVMKNETLNQGWAWIYKFPFLWSVDCTQSFTLIRCCTVPKKKLHFA